MNTVYHTFVPMLITFDITMQYTFTTLVANISVKMLDGPTMHMFASADSTIHTSSKVGPVRMYSY